jgi:hypothetical protein
MLHTARKTGMTLAALGALALGGSALAGAATKSSSSTSSASSASTAAQTAQPPGGGGAAGGHVGANGRTETLLTGDTAAKVEAAALARVSGGTIERVETDVDHGSPYEAHVRKADGTSVEVLVTEAFQVTAVNAMGR